MAKQTANSGLIAKLGDKLRKAHENHKADDVKYDANGGLPAGIENGIAQLKTCKFGQYEKGDNKGEFYLMMTGIIVEPKAHEGVPVQGLRTSIMEPMCDTPTRSRKSVDDHVSFVYNEFKKLGADTADADPDNLEELAAAIQEAAPYFRFRTWKGSVATSGQYAGKESRTQEVWNGIVAGYEQEVAGEVEDETEEAAKPAPAKKPAPSAPAPKPAPSAGPPKKAAAKPAPEPEPEAEEEAEEEADAPDLAALLKAANSGKGKAGDAAKVELERLAVAAGNTEEDVSAAENWEEVVAMIEAAGAAGAEDEPAGDEEGAADFLPVKEEVYVYFPVVNGKKAKKSVEVEVTAVDPKSKTVTLKDLDNPKLVYKSVPWGELESA